MDSSSLTWAFFLNGSWWREGGGESPTATRRCAVTNDTTGTLWKKHPPCTVFISGFYSTGGKCLVPKCKGGGHCILNVGKVNSWGGEGGKSIPRGKQKHSLASPEINAVVQVLITYVRSRLHMYLYIVTAFIPFRNKAMCKMYIRDKSLFLPFGDIIHFQVSKE